MKNKRENLENNSSKLSLTETEKSLLVKILRFLLPPKQLNCSEYLINLELFYRSINNVKTLWDNLDFIKTRIKDVALTSFVIIIFFQWRIWSAKACVRYFSLFLKDKFISSLVRTKYIQKKFTLQLFFLPTVSRTFILSWATTRYPPPWNFLFRKNNCMCNRDNARDVATCPDE